MLRGSAVDQGLGVGPRVLEGFSVPDSREAFWSSAMRLQPVFTGFSV